MKIKRIEHVGVVVRDLEASRRLWEGCFGIRLGGVEEYSIKCRASAMPAAASLSSTRPPPRTALSSWQSCPPNPCIIRSEDRIRRLEPISIIGTSAMEARRLPCLDPGSSPG